MSNPNIEEIFESKAILRGGIKLYHWSEAMQLVELCINHNIPVLGIDAFVVSDECTLPVMEHSIDFSSCHLKDNTNACSFLELRKNLNLMYEIVY